MRAPRSFQWILSIVTFIRRKDYPSGVEMGLISFLLLLVFTAMFAVSKLPSEGELSRAVLQELSAPSDEEQNIPYSVWFSELFEAILVSKTDFRF